MYESGHHCVLGNHWQGVHFLSMNSVNWFKTKKSIKSDKIMQLLIRTNIKHLHLFLNLLQYICTELNSAKHIITDHVILTNHFKNTLRTKECLGEGVAHQWFKSHSQRWMRIYCTLLCTCYQLLGRKCTVIKNPKGTLYYSYCNNCK